eukprot:363355-Alexandrium_andersonii.AAC.1
MLRVTRGGLRIEADCSTGGPWAHCGLHFGHPAAQRCQEMCTPPAQAGLDLDHGPRKRPGGSARCCRLMWPRALELRQC